MIFGRGEACESKETDARRPGRVARTALLIPILVLAACGGGDSSEPPVDGEPVEVERWDRDRLITELADGDGFRVTYCQGLDLIDETYDELDGGSPRPADTERTEGHTYCPDGVFSAEDLLVVVTSTTSPQATIPPQTTSPQG